MTAHHPDSSSTDETLARHQAFAEVLEGKRQMRWSDWAVPIYDSKCLTAAGQRAAIWAMETLQHALGDDFLQRAAAAPAIHPIYSFGLWSGANDVPWVHANLFQLAAQIELQIRSHSRRWRDVQQTMSWNLDTISWIHSLLQLEIASLGLKAGWQSQFEPELGNGKRADVSLTNGSLRLLVETVSMPLSVREREALSFFRNLSRQLLQLKWQFGVQISGSLGNPLPTEAEAQWLQEINQAVEATAQDGSPRTVPNSAGGQLKISREALTAETVLLESAPVGIGVCGRLVARLNDKNNQAAGGGPVWVRLEEYAGLWAPLQGMALSEKCDFLAPALQEALASFPNLAGVILSPAVLWAGDAPSEALNARIESNGGIALRCPIPGHRVRESIIVSQAGQFDEHPGIFADWYEQEATWLDWALAQLGHPLFDTLVQEP